MGHIDGVEINVPGDDQGADSESLSLLLSVMPQSFLLKGKMKAALEKESGLAKSDWYLDCVSIRDSNIERINFEFSHPADIYGLWVIESLCHEGKIQFLNVSRVQS